MMGLALYRGTASSPTVCGKAQFRDAGADQGVDVLLVIWVIFLQIAPDGGRKQRHQLRKRRRVRWFEGAGLCA